MVQGPPDGVNGIVGHAVPLTEDLYIAFDRVGVSYALQNQMIAMLAPMQRDIVKR